MESNNEPDSTLVVNLPIHTSVAYAKTAKLSDVPDEIWALILSKLEGKDRVRSKAVCPGWFKLIESLAPSSLPWLVLPPGRDNGFCFYNHEDQLYHMKNMPEQKLNRGNGICLGSCCGWLLYLNDELEFMLLLNPFSWNQIPLPPLLSFPDVLKVKDGEEDHEIHLMTQGRGKVGLLMSNNPPVTAIEFESMMRTKAVLSSRPTCRKEERIGVVVMFIFGDDYLDFLKLQYNKLAFCTTPAEEDSKWIKLNEHEWYLDIMSHDQQFYALRKDFSVEVWDFPDASVPIKRKVIQGDASLMLKEYCMFELDKYWIVKAGEDILLLVLKKGSRYKQRPESILVYKLDSGEKWTKVESIGNHVLLLGFNQPILRSGHNNPDFDPKGSVYVITKVPYSCVETEIEGFRYFTSVYNFGDNQ